MLSIVSATSGSSKHALVLISLIVVVTIVDSQFVNAFYGTSSLGSPGNLHLLLFVSIAIIASIINTILLLFAKRNDIQERSTRSFSTYMITLTRQEKEKLVLDLYYNQGKTYRQIAEEARICPCDIKTILDNVVKGRESGESLSFLLQYLFFLRIVSQLNQLNKFRQTLGDINYVFVKMNRLSFVIMSLKKNMTLLVSMEPDADPSFIIPTIRNSLIE